MGKYLTVKINSLAEVKHVFSDGRADEYNWLLLSTAGVHGSYATLHSLKDRRKRAFHLGEKTESITVLLIKPRQVILGWGEIEIEATDIPYLEKLVLTSLRAIIDTQKGNIGELNEEAPEST